MDDLTDGLADLANYFGYGPPFMYAGAALVVFLWLDTDASEEAKATLANTMKLGVLEENKLAFVLVELFDRLYTYPLLSWRAFVRAMIFTLLITAMLFVDFADRINPSDMKQMTFTVALSMLCNVITDYIALFIIRPWLKWCGSKSVSTLMSRTIIGVLVMLIGATARWMALYLSLGLAWYFPELRSMYGAIGDVPYTYLFAAPAAVAFAWLPLFMIGVMVSRFLLQSTWLVEKAQWFSRYVTEHPLQMIGCVAWLVTFIVSASWQSLKT
jgi:hypothetical protein